MKREYIKFSYIVIFSAIAFFGSAWLLLTNPSKVAASGTISGRVFQDFNGNGDYNITGSTTNPAIDIGMSAITVTVYDSAGKVCGTATTAADGTYSIAATGTGPYRVEFTGVPTGYFPSARSTDSVSGGTVVNSGSAVQFVSDGNTSNVNFAVNKPADYCQNNPWVCSAVQRYGDELATPTQIMFPYNYSSDVDGNYTGSWTTTPPTRTNTLDPTTLSTNAQVGTIYGQAWDKTTKTIYFSSFLKRHAPFGALSSESTGAIYKIVNPVSGGTPVVYADLNSIYGAGTAGTNPHPIATTNWQNDTSVAALIGKGSLGDIELSADNSILYVVNLSDKRLYAVPTSGTLNTTTVQRYSIPTSNLPTGDANCPTSDVRPFALGRDASGNIYVGAVCSAETSQLPAQMMAYVWRFSGGTFTRVLTERLDYSRSPWYGGVYSQGNGYDWSPWVTKDDVSNFAQPMLSDIEFDRGQMILGFRDRFGDQVPKNATRPDQDPWSRGLGETLRACVSGTTWVFESNGTCGGVTTAGDNNGGGSYGPGGGEFYYLDYSGDGTAPNNNKEAGQGALLQIAGFNHVLTTAYDAVYTDSSGTIIQNNYNTGGVQRYNNTTGTMTGAYDVYLAGETGYFAKANGLGDLEALCDSAPIEIGNRIWRDLDNDGVQDPNEPGIAGVTVRLYNASGTLVATAVTDANGEYYFSSASGTSTSSVIFNLNLLSNTGYSLRLDNPTNYASGNPLNGIFLTSRDMTTQGGNTEGSDSDAGNVPNPTGSPSGTFPVVYFTTGGEGNNNHTFDIGFSTVAPSAGEVGLSGRVVDSRQRGIRGVTVTLTDSSGMSRTATSNAFGYYFFNDIEAGQTVILQVFSKRHTFNPSSQVLSVEDNVTNANFVGSAIMQTQTTQTQTQPTPTQTVPQVITSPSRTTIISRKSLLDQ